MIVADHAGHPLFAGGRPAGVQGAAAALSAGCGRHRHGLLCICRVDQAVVLSRAWRKCETVLTFPPA